MQPPAYMYSPLNVLFMKWVCVQILQMLYTLTKHYSWERTHKVYSIQVVNSKWLVWNLEGEQGSANSGQRNGLVRSGGEAIYIRTDKSDLNHDQGLHRQTFCRFHFIIASIKDHHVTYIMLRPSLTNKASNSPVLPHGSFNRILQLLTLSSVTFSKVLCLSFSMTGSSNWLEVIWPWWIL